MTFSGSRIEGQCRVFCPESRVLNCDDKECSWEVGTMDRVFCWRRDATRREHDIPTELKCIRLKSSILKLPRNSLRTHAIKRQRAKSVTAKNPKKILEGLPLVYAVRNSHPWEIPWHFHPSLDEEKGLSNTLLVFTGGFYSRNVLQRNRKLGWLFRGAISEPRDQGQIWVRFWMFRVRSGYYKCLIFWF